MLRTILCCLVMLTLSVGCQGRNDNKAKEGTITKVDAAKGTAAVKLHKDGKDVESTFSSPRESSIWTARAMWRPPTSSLPVTEC